LFLILHLNRREILRFAQNDKTRHFFRSLFSLRILDRARANPHRLKPAPLSYRGQTNKMHAAPGNTRNAERSLLVASRLAASATRKVFSASKSSR
jgi:hypothetical protein